MKDPHQIIQRPVITEKSTAAMEQNCYLFEVASDSNRIEIKNAIESIFDVKVRKVNSVWRRGKHRRMGLQYGVESDQKRALVTLEPGYKIDLL